MSGWGWKESSSRQFGKGPGLTLVLILVLLPRSELRDLEEARVSSSVKQRSALRTQPAPHSRTI